MGIPACLSARLSAYGNVGGHAASFKFTMEVLARNGRSGLDFPFVTPASVPLRHPGLDPGSIESTGVRK
jgi:hypothetical protein